MHDNINIYYVTTKTYRKINGKIITVI